jgi:glycosyltransferase involved in cell wall biosynthesis
LSAKAQLEPDGPAPRVLVNGTVLDQPMGGVRRHNAELLPRLARLLGEAGGSLAVLEGRSGLALELPEEVERISSAVPSRPPLLRALREGRALTRALKEAAAAGRPFDLVHTGHLPAPRALGTPLTLTIHDLRSLDLANSAYSRRLIARSVIGHALHCAAAVFAVSEFTAERLRERWPEVTEKLSLVPNAADHFEPLPRTRGEDACLLHLGHLEPRKNLELLVRALDLDSDLPDLVLSGTAKGDEEQRLRSLARELGVEHRVQFPGAFEERDLPRLLATCAAVVLPSRLEGFGIVALEAQRARAPLAVSTAGALPAIAGPGVPNFDPDDPAECARALRAALAQPEATLDAHAQRAGEHHWDSAAELWLSGLRRAARRERVT